jgi:hypothetical protein
MATAIFVMLRRERRISPGDEPAGSLMS